MGYEWSSFLDSIIGVGTVFFLIFSLLVFLIYFFDITSFVGLGKRKYVFDLDGEEDFTQDVKEEVVEVSTKTTTTKKTKKETPVEEPITDELASLREAFSSTDDDVEEKEIKTTEVKTVIDSKPVTTVEKEPIVENKPEEEPILEKEEIKHTTHHSVIEDEKSDFQPIGIQVEEAKIEKETTSPKAEDHPFAHTFERSPFDNILDELEKDKHNKPRSFEDAKSSFGTETKKNTEKTSTTEKKEEKIDKAVSEPIIQEPKTTTVEMSVEVENPTSKEVKEDLGFVVEDATQDDDEVYELEQVTDFYSDEGNTYDPTLTLRNFQLPTLAHLEDRSSNKIDVTEEELKANKDRIVETLANYKLGIKSIKATIGPTVTLYEIVPADGVRISKIKNLEDDIALSLAALGIRIIAPIPGKGTIGIEVPNKNRETVSARSVLGSRKFQESDMALPVVFGKTITNEIFMIDLAKMPHMLMAGATGQGKSVGLNVLIASLLYRKHPAHLKFVLVDPKKVEFSIFEKIEQHYLAKLPDEEDAIITDTSKVIYTLNSLCIEMDQRYDLLKSARCRNLKEYNAKFIKRTLDPEKGHRFMPYIVVIIDELADLMMTAGKEVETPIARLAQLARAIGIHLVVATQRPSVNVITGVIKANFPARVSFRVSGQMDSRTILDSKGAEQLVGMGDMLFTQGMDVTRLQCAFIDTPEIENIVSHIGNQQGYPTALLLPEVMEEGDDNGASDVDLSERDALFEDAARIIVGAQQGSTSLLQRKLKLGYNRAGRVIDQLEAAGIVGPFQGSKAREVYISDEYSLEQLLKDL
ncbi:MAG: DNA translocase FtsK [Cytophagales bacterium]|nr:DNA translocase FtsK [Cytophagales bacterium]